MKWEEEGERPTTLSEADVESNGGGDAARASGPRTVARSRSNLRDLLPRRRGAATPSTA